jgi:beta-glucanase (GH16 family)
MIKKWASILLTLLIYSQISCSTESDSDLNVAVSLGENGIVNVTATANQAVVYRFSFGADAVFENNSGNMEYTYQNKGTYTIGIWAFFDKEYNTYTYQSVEVEITTATGTAAPITTPSLIDTSEEVTIHSGYELVWNDEFNYDGPPAEEKWHHQYIPIFGGGWANNEKQHYTPRLDNSYVSEGTLKIVAKRESYNFEGSVKSFTSARLNSKFDLQYGRIDVKAKLPSSQGTWPAIWTLGTNVGERGNFHGSRDGQVGWPDCGEIDIMEQGADKAKVLGTFHWADSNSGEYGSYGVGKTIGELNIDDVTTNFHVYSLVWTQAAIKVYVDDTLLIQLSNNSNLPFDNPHYLILNVAMGGSIGGTIPNSFSEDVMEIDYVRFYQ